MQIKQKYQRRLTYLSPNIKVSTFLDMPAAKTYDFLRKEYPVYPADKN